MGARISIQFKNGDNKSVVLFNHWGGEEFAEEAREYVKELKEEVKDSQAMPLHRLEPNTVMVDFIRSITKNLPRVEGSLYLAKNETEGDNSDYGHHIINLN